MLNCLYRIKLYQLCYLLADLSEDAVHQIEKNLRHDLGRKGVESNAFEKIFEKSHRLEKFYTTETLEFENIVKIGNKKVKQSVMKDLVFVNDPSELIFHVCKERNMTVQDTIVRLGIDGGQSSLKVVINIFNPDEPDSAGPDGQKFTGVNKMIVLALVRDIQETHSNLETILTKAKINEISFKLACDLKVLNLILGLSAHGGKYACMYCDGSIEALGKTYPMHMDVKSYLQTL